MRIGEATTPLVCFDEAVKAVSVDVMGVAREITRLAVAPELAFREALDFVAEVVEVMAAVSL